MALVLDESSSLNIGPGLVCDLHDKLPVVADHHVEDVQVHRGAQIVNIGDEAVLLPILQQLIQETGV